MFFAQACGSRQFLRLTIHSYEEYSNNGVMTWRRSDDRCWIQDIQHGKKRILHERSDRSWVGATKYLKTVVKEYCVHKYRQTWTRVENAANIIYNFSGFAQWAEPIPLSFYFKSSPINPKSYCSSCYRTYRSCLIVFSSLFETTTGTDADGNFK